MSTFHRFRTKPLVYVVCFFTFLTLVGIPQLMQARAKEKIRLGGGTLVALSLDKAIDSDMPINTIVDFHVLRDVVVGDKLLVKSGATATGTIARASTSGAVGAAGKVMINLRSVQAVDGQEVFLRGSVDAEGESKVGTSVILGLICLPLLLIQGGDATIPAGSEVRAYAEQDYMIEVP